MSNTTDVNGKSPGEGAMTEEGFEGWILDHHESVPVLQTAGRVCKVDAEYVRFKVTTSPPEEIPAGRERWEGETGGRDGKFLLWGESEPDTPLWQSGVSGGQVGKIEKRRERKRWERKKKGLKDYTSEEKLPLTQQRKASRSWARATTLQELNE